MMQYIVDLTKPVRQRQRGGYRVIVIGDINLNIRKDDRLVNTWKERMHGLGMINIQKATCEMLYMAKWRMQSMD